MTKSKDKVLQNSATYDNAYVEGGNNGVYNLHYKKIIYYPMYKYTLKLLKSMSAKSVLEVGCGPGHFAHMLLERTKLEYKGFDFSSVAIHQAATRTGKADLFRVADAYNQVSYIGSYDSIVCTEVLEHIENDIAVIDNWPKNINTVCSVPNYDSPYHVRFFESEVQVYERYSKVIDIKKIFKVKTPQIPILGVTNRLKYAWKNFDNKKRLLRAFDLDAESNNCWYIFIGIKK